jgi:hypothetical protein
VSVISITVFVITYALIAGERVSVRMRTDRLDEPHRGGRCVASEVGQSAGNVFELRLQQYVRYAGSHTGRARPPRTIATSSSPDTRISVQRDAYPRPARASREDAHPR